MHMILSVSDMTKIYQEPTVDLVILRLEPELFIIVEINRQKTIIFYPVPKSNIAKAYFRSYSTISMIMLA